MTLQFLKRKKYLIIFSTLFFSILQQNIAQESMQLSLEQAQTYALQHNRTLKNASFDIKKAEAEKWSTIATLLPQVNGTFDYANMMGYKLQMMGFDIAMPPYYTIGVTTSLTFSAGQFIGIKIHNIAREMADISLKQTEQQILNKVKTVYFSILVMNETVLLLDSNLNNMRTLQEHTENSVKVGILNQTEADKISVQIASVENSVNSVKRALEMLYNAMRLQLGLDIDTQIQLTQKIEDIINVSEAEKLLSVNFQPENNYSYKLLQSSVNLSKQQLNLKKWAYAPTLTAFHSYSKKEYFSDEPTMNMTPPNILGVSIKVPIFSSGSRFAAVKAADLDYKKQLNNLTDVKDGLAIQYRQLSYNLKTAIEAYEAQKKNIKVNKQVFENVSRMYAQGMASVLDITNAGSNLISAQSSYVQTMMDIVSAQITIEELINN